MGMGMKVMGEKREERKKKRKQREKRELLLLFVSVMLQIQQGKKPKTSQDFEISRYALHVRAKLGLPGNTGKVIATKVICDQMEINNRRIAIPHLQTPTSTFSPVILPKKTPREAESETPGKFLGI